MKLAPNAFRVRLRTSSKDLVACAGVNPDNWIKPRPPAFETAAANGGLASDPMAAICIGTLQPVNSVNFVLSIRRQAAPLELMTSVCLGIIGPLDPVCSDRRIV